MANGLKEVKKTSPCYICGKGDWCCRYIDDEGFERSVCKRGTNILGTSIQASVGQGVVGINGEYYVLVRETNGGHSEWMNAKDKKASLDAYRARKQAEWELRIQENNPYDTKCKEESFSIPQTVFLPSEENGKSRKTNITRDILESFYSALGDRLPKVRRGDQKFAYPEEVCLFVQENFSDLKDGVALYHHKKDDKEYFKVRKDKYGRVSDDPIGFNPMAVQPVRPVQPKVIDDVQPLPNETIDKINRCLIDHLVLEPYHREYLISEGWTDEMLEKYHVRSFPEKDFTRFQYRQGYFSKNPYRKKLAKTIMSELILPSLKGYPGAYRVAEDKDEWTLAGPSGILFFMPDVNGRLYRTRIRMDFRDVSFETQDFETKNPYFVENGVKKFISMKGIYVLDGDEKRFVTEVKGKYRNFASWHEDEEAIKRNEIRNSYIDGCRSGNALGFYFDSQRDDMHIAFITEGEKKAAFANYKLKAPFISVPGVDSWSLLFKSQDGIVPVERLKQSGCNVLIVAYDADKGTNEAVLDRERKTVEALKKEGFIVGVAEWDIRSGKGIDDLLAHGKKPSYTCM